MSNGVEIQMEVSKQYQELPSDLKFLYAKAVCNPCKGEKCNKCKGSGMVWYFLDKEGKKSIAPVK